MVGPDGLSRGTRGAPRIGAAMQARPRHRLRYRHPVAYGPADTAAGGIGLSFTTPSPGTVRNSGSGRPVQPVASAASTRTNTHSTSVSNWSRAWLQHRTDYERVSLPAAATRPSSTSSPAGTVRHANAAFKHCACFRCKRAAALGLGAATGAFG
jgi:hypothetical protein